MTPTLAPATTCPACAGPMEPDLRRNALSRQQPGVYVCTGCGVKEAMTDLGAPFSWIDVDSMAEDARADMLRAKVGDDLAERDTYCLAMFQAHGDRLTFDAARITAKAHGHETWTAFLDSLTPDEQPQARPDGSVWTVDVLLALGY